MPPISFVNSTSDNMRNSMMYNFSNRVSILLNTKERTQMRNDLATTFAQVKKVHSTENLDQNNKKFVLQTAVNRVSRFEVLQLSSQSTVIKS